MDEYQIDLVLVRPSGGAIRAVASFGDAAVAAPTDPPRIFVLVPPQALDFSDSTPGPFLLLNNPI